MKYEIPREAFKQRLEDRLNFVFVDLLPADKSPAKFENIVNIKYSSDFKNEFASQFPNKNQNIMIFSLNTGDENPSLAAEELSSMGYNFVYYYQGNPDDAILDKGLN